jgi:hypothetical protein
MLRDHWQSNTHLNNNKPCFIQMPVQQTRSSIECVGLLHVRSMSWYSRCPFVSYTRISLTAMSNPLKAITDMDGPNKQTDG